MDSSSLTVAYLAGFFDGEGSIGFTIRKKTNNRYYGMRITMVQIKEEPLLLAQDYFGCGSICNWKNSAGNTQYQWFVSSKNAATILKEMLPYLTVKKEQAKLAIEYQEKPWRGKRRTEEQVKIDHKLVKKIGELKH